MKTMAMMMFAIVAFVVVGSSAEAKDPSPIRQIHVSECYRNCADCEHKCGPNNNSCFDMCFQMSTVCCSAAGHKAVYKGCGCY